MIKFYCNLCSSPTENPNDTPTFYCEMHVRKSFQVSKLDAGSVQIKPQLQAKQFHICEECFTNKFPKELLDR